MLRLGGVLIALAWVVVGWRNMPRLEDPQALAAGIAVGVTCLLAYFMGRRSSSATAIAQAVASAEARARARASATSTSQAVGNVFVVGAGGAVAPSPAGDRMEYLGGLDAAPWIGAPKPLMEQDVMESIGEDTELYVSEDFDRG